MAKVSFAAPVNEIRGRLGGIIYSANQSGSYAKPFAKSSNPRTAFQATQRVSLQQFAIMWQTLSTAIRALWNAYAALPAQAKTDSLGNTYYVSGFNWFISFNILQISVGRAPWLAAPSATVVPTIVPSTLVCNKDPANNCVVTYPTPPGTGADTLFHFQLRLTSGRLTVPIRDYVLIHHVNRDDFTNPVTISNLDDFFGPIQAGQTLWLRSHRKASQGRDGPSEFISAVAA